MKVQKVKNLCNSSVYGSDEVYIEATKEETDELRNALKILDRWKKQVRQAVRHKEDQANFTMYKFAVKTDLVVVTLEAGACG